MILDDEMFSAAEDRAEQHLRFRGEDDQWAAFGDLLADEPARQREQAVQMLALEHIRDRLYPGIDRKRWAKLGWNDVLSGRKPVEQFIHHVRLAKAAGSENGKL